MFKASSKIDFMWKCEKCGRSFEKTKQPHSCRSVPLGDHFKNKEKAKEVFDFLVKKIDSQIGKVKIISLPCCVHLFGKYDFLAILPKKDKLEIHFASDVRINDPRVKQNFPISAKTYEICVCLDEVEDIDREPMKWLNKAYHLKDKEISR